MDAHKGTFLTGGKAGMSTLRARAAVLAAAAGPLGLAAAGLAPPGPALALGAGLALVSWLLVRTKPAARPLPVPPDGKALPRDPARDALERLPVPVLVIAAQERVVFANDAARALFGGHEPGVLLPALIRHPQALAAVRRAASTGRQHDARFAMGRPDERFMRLLALPLPDRRLLLMCSDETQLHRAEHMRAGFLANASHELRTPLASLSGYIDTLRGHARNDAAAQARFLDIMAGQAGRMGRLIDDLLSLSRIEMDEHLPPSAVVDLGAVIRDVRDALRPIAKADSVVLDLALPEEPVAITGDRDQVVQMVQNLVDNAIKYSAPGSRVQISLRCTSTAMQDKALGETAPRLHIVTAPRTSGTAWAVLQVRDSGPGIAAEHLPRLGGRFYRVEEGKSGTRTGTGLGLAIVKHIVARHQGGLSVESLPGTGTVFTVALAQAPAGQG